MQYTVRRIVVFLDDPVVLYPVVLDGSSASTSLAAPGAMADMISSDASGAILFLGSINRLPLIHQCLPVAGGESYLGYICYLQLNLGRLQESYTFLSI